jgi:hypothetical protein
MYIIDKTKNRITKIENKNFTELGFRERSHLQEWLANSPEALGEEILIIQKEFSRFEDTKERLDLLGIDKKGDLVIIENKCDDTGKDVTWQALKYASYCSTLKKNQIIQIYQDFLDKQVGGQIAERKLTEFFKTDDFEEIILNSGQSQRIILVAYNFKKEVTSTVLWLLINYKLRIQCFKATPYKFADQVFLNIEQIIPVKGAEDYMIKMAEKTQEDISTQTELKSREHLLLEFWKRLLSTANGKFSSFQSISPSKDPWIGVSAGISGVQLNFVVSKSYARVEVYISRSDKQENKNIFNLLLADKVELEKVFGNFLIWEELPDKKASRIKYELSHVSYTNEEDWNTMISFMVENMISLEKTFREPILKSKNRI